MSRHADLLRKLPELLNRYPSSCHRAIVETFSETLEEDWGHKDVQEFLLTGAPVSQEAMDEVKVQLGCWGIEG